MWSGPESERQDFPRGNTGRVGFGDDTVMTIFVAVKRVFRVHDDEFDEVWEHFVELNGILERRIWCVDDGISHVG